MRTLHTVALMLTVLGGINWGLVGLLDVDLVAVLLGGFGLTSIMHVMMGAAGLWVLVDTLKTHDLVKL